MLTLGTALWRRTPLFLVRGSWERSKWSISSGMLGKPSPSRRYRFYGVSRQVGVVAKGCEGKLLPPCPALPHSHQLTV